MSDTTDTAVPALLLGETGSDPIEDRLRETVRATIEALFDEELAAFLGRLRYGRGGGARKVTDNAVLDFHSHSVLIMRVVSRRWWKLEGGVISGCSKTHPTGGCNRQGDHAMTETTDTAVPALLLGEAGSDPIEDRLRETVRATIEALFDEELTAFLGRLRYGRGDGARKGYRHGRRERELVCTFGAETISVPRARIEGEDGKTTEWRSKALSRYQRRTKRAEALIAAV
jgi:hypothetical protein